MRFAKLTVLMVVLGLVMALVAACGAEATATPTATPRAAPLPTATPAPVPDPFASVQGLVNPANHGWPREVEGLNGRVTIAAKPQRILTISLGHDEITYALVPKERVVGVGAFTKKSDYSNVAELAKDAPTITRDPEKILAQRPDIVIASAFTKAEDIKALQNVGLTVVQADARNDTQSRIEAILFLGYIYGEETRAVAFANEVRARLDALQAFTKTKPPSARPRVLSLNRYADQLWTAGFDSTEGAIVEAAGGLNVAAEAGIARNQTTSLEGIIAMRPEVIIIPQPLERTESGEGAEEFKQDLLKNPALANVPAIKTGRIYPVLPGLYTTLSFWNIRGAEGLAKLLWPQELGNKDFAPFSLPK